MNVLLALDLRADAAEVFARAMPWLERLQAKVDLLFADPHAGMLRSLGVPDPEGTYAAALADDRRALEALMSALPPERRGRALVDGASPEAAVVTRSADYALVIVGTHGRAGWRRLWLGSVAERTARLSPTSVLVVRDGPLAARPRLLLAVDLAEDSGALVEAAGRFAARIDGVVDLMYVDASIAAASAYGDGPWLQIALEHIGDLRIRGEAALRLLRDRLPEAQRGGVHVISGVPVQALVERLADYDLGIVGTHGRQGVDHLVVGSVAERVVRLASRPVLVLRP